MNIKALRRFNIKTFNIQNTTVYIIFKQFNKTYKNKGNHMSGKAAHSSYYGYGKQNYFLICWLKKTDILGGGVPKFKSHNGKGVDGWVHGASNMNLY